MYFELFTPLMIGFIGSLHCLGMCGPLVLAYSIHLRDPSCSAQPNGFSLLQKGLIFHLAFHLGRLTTYGLLGGLAAGLFQAGQLSRLFFDIGNGLMYFGGALLIFFGMVLLKVLPLPAFLVALSGASGSMISARVPSLLHSRTPGSKFALGLATGFVPCCLSWAMIVTAATTQSPSKGFLTMVAFGLGTLPALFLVGFSTSFLSMKVRFLGERVAALSVTAMGVVLILRGAGILT
jgi:uncharacterized protein